MNRTVKFLGYAYSESDVSLEVTAGGNIVFSGSVPVLGTDVSEQETVGLAHPDAELFEFEIPVEFSGNLAMSITPTGGSIVLAPVYANYNAWTLPEVGPSSLIVGQTYTIKYHGTFDWTTVGATDSNVGTTFTATGQGTGTGVAYANTPPGYATGTASGFAEIYFSEGPATPYRVNTEIDGIAQADPGDDGVYWWTVANGSTITFDLLVDAGIVA